MYHLHTLIHMSYVYPQICLTRKGNTTIIEAPFIGSGCGRVVQGAGRKAKRMVLQCINGVGSNPVEGRKKNLSALKSNSNTVWFNFQTYIIFRINLVSFKVNLRSSGTDILYGCHLLLDDCIIYFISCDYIVNSSLSYTIYLKLLSQIAVKL